jgi:hypothetical protein
MGWDKKKQGVDPKKAEAFQRGFLERGKNVYKDMLSKENKSPLTKLNPWSKRKKDESQ